MFERINPDSILQQAYTQLADMGANALIGFTYESVTKSVNVGEVASLVVPGLSISGMAIKRK